MKYSITNSHVWLAAGACFCFAVAGCQSKADTSDYTFACDPNETDQCLHEQECLFDPSRNEHVCAPEGTEFDAGSDAVDTSDTTDTADIEDTPDVRDTTDSEDIETDTEDTSDADAADAGCTTTDDCEVGFYCETSSGECLEGCGVDNDCPSGEYCGDDNNCTVVNPPCGVSEPPERCSSTEPVWGPASVIDQVRVAGGTSASDFDASNCCYDFDQDGNDDNGYGQVLADFPELLWSIQDANDGFDSTIADELRIALEFQGLSNLTSQQGGLGIASYSADMQDDIISNGSSNNALELGPEDFVTGTYFPKYYIDSASYDQTGGRSTITSDLGTMVAPLSLLATITVPLQDASLYAEVDRSESTTGDKGIYIVDGTIAGYVRVEDIYGAYNRFASTCTCSGAGPGEDLILYDEQKPWDASSTSCNSAYIPDGCTGSCEIVIDDCGSLTSVLPGLMDLDVDGDSNDDALSVGLRFTAAGAYVESASTN